MKKLMAVLLVAVMLLATSVSAFAYNVDPTMAYGYYNNGYGYNNGYYNGYGYNNTYVMDAVTGIRSSYGTETYQGSPWFEQSYVEQYGMDSHTRLTMPILRSYVFLVSGLSMEKMYADNGRQFSNSYGAPFKDLTWDASRYGIAGGLYQRGIMIGDLPDSSGMRTVRLTDYINRAEAAKVVDMVASQNGLVANYTNVNHKFEDTVGEYAWCAEYASKCHALGLMYGKSNTHFAPGDKLTVEEFIAIMLRLAERLEAQGRGYSLEVEDIIYGITNAMDIDFEGYSFGIDDISVYGAKTVYANIGDRVELKVKASPSDVELNKNSINWKSNKNSYLEYLDDEVDGKYATGEFKAKREGRITVTASVANDEDIYVEFTVVISDEDEVEEEKTTYVSSIKLNPTSVNLSVGESKSITATIYPTNATNKGVIWESHNPNVATVDQNGNITAVGVGNTTVTCTAKDGSGVIATIEVTVKAEEVIVPSDTVAPMVELTGADSIDIGKIATLTVKVNEDNIKNFTITEKDILGLTGGASINKISKISDDTYEIRLMGVEVSSMALCIGAGVAEDTAGNISASSNEVIVFINSGE